MNRRKFLKYLGATAAVAGTSAVGLDYILSSPQSPVNQITTGLNATTASSKTNHWPVVNFKRQPFYLNSTDQQTIQFTSDCYDADNDPLTYAWYVDGSHMSEQKDYSTRLTTGDHLVRLEVSDSLTTNTASQWVTVEPDQIYPARPLHLMYKGITYFAGPVPPDWAGIPNPDHDEMDEQLDTIRNELGCNAIIISGGEDYEDKLIECGRIAIEKGFERIHIQPRYMGATPSETVEKIAGFAPKVKMLRELSESVVYCIGHEFTNETSDILPGETWIERFNYPTNNPDWTKKAAAKLPKMFGDIVGICKERYGYEISYAAIAVVEADLVPWQDPVFESVGVDAMIQEKYGWTEDWILGLLSGLKRYRKPVDCMEAGCETFTGSAEAAGTSPLLPAQDRQYDEDEQADWIGRECNTLDRARIDGYFYTQYNDPPGWDTGYGLYNPDTRKRKRGFYLYKSYQRVT